MTAPTTETSPQDSNGKIRPFTQEQWASAIKSEGAKFLNQFSINDALLKTPSLGEVATLNGLAESDEWTVCQHLKSTKCDEACSCGYRGNIWSGSEVHLLEMGVTPHLGDDMINTPSREKQIVTAHYICALHNWFRKEVLPHVSQEQSQ